MSLIDNSRSTGNNIPFQLADRLILGTENKLKIVREYKRLSVKQLAKMASLDKERVLFIETHKIELLEPDLCKLAAVLQIDEELLLDSSILISRQEAFSCLFICKL